MFYKNYIEKIYIINGLARSGNHLFITWLISTFNDNEVYYLNNIKPSYYGLISKKNIDINIISRYHTVTNDNKYGLKIDKIIRKKLVGTKDMNNFLHNKKKIKILIITMENKKIEKINMLSKLFIKCNNIYKCIVIRDILNLFSSRIESEKKLIKNDYYETDKITVEYWLDNYINIKNKNFIVFNYNKFLCYTVTRKALAKKLNIDYNKSKITLNRFGLTSGSSFKNTVTNKSDYFMRWTKYKNNKLIKQLINNNKIIEILCKDFSMCLNFDNKKIKICKKNYILE
jgi:hypothetical protein